MNLLPSVPDGTGQITSLDTKTISLAPGVYLVSLAVSALFRSANYMQVTPVFNGQPQLALGIYYATSATGSSACGASHFIIRAPAGTQFTLNYSGSAPATDGQTLLTLLKLNPPA